MFRPTPPISTGRPDAHIGPQEIASLHYTDKGLEVTNLILAPQWHLSFLLSSSGTMSQYQKQQKVYKPICKYCGEEKTSRNILRHQQECWGNPDNQATDQHKHEPPLVSKVYVPVQNAELASDDQTQKKNSRRRRGPPMMSPAAQRGKIQTEVRLQTCIRETGHSDDDEVFVYHGEESSDSSSSRGDIPDQHEPKHDSHIEQLTLSDLAGKEWEKLKKCTIAIHTMQPLMDDVDDVDDEANDNDLLHPQEEREGKEADNTSVNPPPVGPDDASTMPLLGDNSQFASLQDFIGPQDRSPGSPDRQDQVLRAKALREAQDARAKIYQLNPDLGRTWQAPNATIPRQLTNMKDKHISMLRLIELCDNHKLPRTFVDKFLDIVEDEMDHRRFNIRDRPKRETVTRLLIDEFSRDKNGNIHLPKTYTLTGIGLATSPTELIDLPELSTSPQATDPNTCRHMVIKYDVEHQICDMLSDVSVMGNLENLVVNKEKPFSPYVNKNGLGDEVLDGSWWKDTIQYMSSDNHNDPFTPGSDFILPLILYCDKTGTDRMQRYPLEPWLMCTPIMKRRFRNMTKHQRCLGYIPDLEKRSSAEKARLNRRKRGAAVANYHLCLDYILSDLRNVQDRGIIFCLRLGSLVRKVRLRPVVAFVACDGKARDLLAGRIAGYSNSVPRISSLCKTSKKECDDVLKVCEFIEVNDVIGFYEIIRKPADEIAISRGISLKEAQTLKERAKKGLREMSLHSWENSFVKWKIDLGYNPQSIWGALPVDLMHAFLLGVLKIFVKLWIDPLNDNAKAELDIYIEEILGNLRSSERKNYPRFKFQRGFSKLSFITADEWPGKLLVLLLVINTHRGRCIFKSTYEDKDIPEPDFPDDLTFDQISSYDFQQKCQEMHQEWLRAHLQEQSEKNINAPAQVVPPEENDKPDGSDSDLSVDAPNQEDEVTTATRQLNTRKDVSQKGPRKKKPRKPPIDSELMEEEAFGHCSFRQLVQLSEMMLSFHAWYKLETPWLFVPGTKESEREPQEFFKPYLEYAVRKMLSLVKLYTPRKTGEGWQLQKLHELLHLPFFVTKYGSPKNFDCGVFESALKAWGKLPSCTAQKRGHDIFLTQTANRIHEFQVRNKAMRELNVKSEDVLSDNDDPQEPLDDSSGEESTNRLYLVPSIKGASRFRIFVKKNLRTLWAGRSAKVKSARNHPGIVEWFFREGQNDKRRYTGDTIQPKKVLSHNGDEIEFWDCFTQVTGKFPVNSSPTESEDRTRKLTVRAHPNFNNEGSWYDWVMVKFPGTPNARGRSGAEELKTTSPFFPDEVVPCKVLAWTKKTSCDNDEELHALVHPCDYRTHDLKCNFATSLLERWHLSYEKVRHNGMPARRPALHFVPVSSIETSCLVVEECPVTRDIIFDEDLEKKKLWDSYNSILLLKDRKQWGKLFVLSSAEVLP